jgi:hypothetical protein
MTSDIRLQACDLCYRKRIRCDGQTPRCSHCQTYSSQCTHEAASRRKKPPKSRLIQLSNPPTPIDNTGLDELYPSGFTSHSGDKGHLNHDFPTLIQTKQLELPVEDFMRPSTSTNDPSLDTLFSSNSVFSWDTEFFSHDSTTPTQMELPAEALVQQLINTYLADINSILPLFDPQQLTQTVEQWYNSPTQRSRTSWAVINVVMAIAQYCSFGQVGFSHADFSVGSVPDCLNKAQSTLTEILMGDVKLANLQVVLGLVIIFQGTSDIKPAGFLISTALRLCQLLGIHRSDSDSYGNTTPREALQLRRVFWIAYILDRDVAMRIRQAPIQQDTDISIELPPKKPDEDAAGFVSTPEMYQHGFNVFRAHVELSQIQGYIYDALFSVRSQQVSPGERAVSCQTIRLLLRDWKSRIPVTLSAEALSQTQSYLPCIPSFLCMLYGKVVTCLGQLCQVNSMDFRWLDQLRYYGRSITTGLGEPCLPPSQPQGWNALVNECREFMPLFVSVQDKGPAFIW